MADGTLFVLGKGVLFDSGQVAPGAKVFFYLAETSTKIEIYTTPALGTPLPNPVPSDNNGKLPAIWLDPADDSIKYVVAPADDTDPPTSPIDTVDDYPLRPAPAAPFFDISDAETAEGFAIVNHVFVAGCVDRYGANDTPGTTDTTAAWNAAFTMGRKYGVEVTYGATWPYRLTSPINATSSGSDDNRGFSVRNLGQAIAVTDYTSDDTPGIIADHTGHVFDCTGSNGITWHGVTVTSGAATPKTCWLLARNSGGGGSIHEFNGCRVRGSFSESVIYNYGAEEDHYFGCQFFNTNGGANAKVGYFTSHNIRSLSSTFATISTGNQSTLGHYFFGGSFFNISHHAAADTFYFDNIALVKFVGPHVACNDETGGGRSFIYVDTVNGGSDNWTVIGFSGEVGTHVPTYGVYLGDTVASMGKWDLVNVRLPHVTNMVKGHANVTASQFNFFNVDDAGVGSGGIDLAGTANACNDMGVTGSFTAGTFTSPNFRRQSMSFARSGEINIELADLSSASDAKYVRIRQASGQFVISLLDDTKAVVSHAMVLTRSGTTPTLMDLSGNTGTKVGQFGAQGTAPISKPTVTGSRGSNAALASLLTALANYGLITDSSS